MSIHVAAPIEIIPANAPFSEQQRKWLNGFFFETLLKSQPPIAEVSAPKEDTSTPWKDPSLPIDDRMAMAAVRPLKQRMMAAMAQQDCGQCGYSCANYASAITEQAEPRLNLCVPGGKATARMLKTLVEEMGGGVLDPEEVKPAKPETTSLPGRSRTHPVAARLLSRRRLNGEGSEKTTMHVEIDLSASALDYEAGDSLGVFAKNPPELADAILAALDIPADFPIADRSLRDVLIEDTSLGLAPDSLFTFISYLTGGERRKKAQALSRGEDPDGDIATLDVLAALQKFPGIHPDPEALIEVLEPMQPRLYSISSSPKTVPGQVTLTVDVVRYDIADRTRHGCASTFLGHRADTGEDVLVYVQKAHNFALPADPATPIIMVGPGTGIAPFRAFLEERQAVAAPGKAWLFYGHQREATDFFYSDELEAMKKSSMLANLSLAWSRDGAQKTYVQHKMIEAGAELYQWLTEGAHFYICGDAKRMAKDVESSLVSIVATHGSLGEEQAKAFVANLKKTQRYQSDVY
ncbi:MAG: sulfite reductase alpha subunit [Devosia sp.]|uniref:sulfite reductase subunit alpha n=1 Tax=Devosia sp. TaxID=1871048 RepID=UPI0026294673|nr:sulfite reductase subunit alpha [Devosia sp.]MDB5527487.1 sulfite reductase alpha subunit [Devosia sp.]